MERESGEARAAYLNEVCGPDLDLRRRVERLLDAQPKMGSFLDSPAAGPTMTLPSPQVVEGPGTVIGPYKLLEQIGEGGMGVVYMAEQTQPVRRKVALKIIKPGMDTRQVIARFEAERQALAIMDHPNIAKVLDAGATESGRPYFVMELVRGIPITEYCDQHRLPINKRLDLFKQVCQAVQHAHQKGIIHRDIKPTNVLVTALDGVPLPRVIDFGIAKATGQSLTDKTLFTGFAQLIGTPLYMSPEQAELSAVDIDTKSDIYSLGVLLYELLTGTTPFDQDTFRTAALDEVRRIIREDEPPRPSTRLSGLGATLTTVSDNRQTDARMLSRSLRGELDWIVMKALEKDRRRRYETASGLARDVERYLAGDPVEAGPPSGWYRLRKFARRNRVVLLTAVVVSLALVAGTTVSVWQAILARRAQASATAQRDEARQAVDDMYSDVAVQWLEQSAALEPMQRKFLQKALDYYLRFAGEESSDLKVRLRTALAFNRVGVIQEKLGQYSDARVAYRRGMSIVEKLAAGAPVVPEYQCELAVFHSNLGSMMYTLGEQAEAEKLLTKATTLVERVVANSSVAPQHQKGLANSHHNLGLLLKKTGRIDGAEREFRRAIELFEKLEADWPAGLEYQGEAANTIDKLAGLLEDTDRIGEAEEQYRRATRPLERRAAAAPSVPRYRYDLATHDINLAVLLDRAGKRAEAEQAYRRANALLEKLAVESPSVPDYRNDLARSHNGLGTVWMNDRPGDAAQAFRRAIALLEKLVAESPSVPDNLAELSASHSNLGVLLKKTGDLTGAEQAYRQAISLDEKLASDSPDVPQYRSGLASDYANIGNMLRMMGRLGEAEHVYRRALALEEKLAAESPSLPQYRCDLACSRKDLADLLSQSGRAAEAEQVYRTAIALFEKLASESPSLPDYHNGLASSETRLAILLQAAGRADEAALEYRHAIGLAEKLTTAEALDELSWALATSPNRGQHDYELALRLARKAVEQEPLAGDHCKALGAAHYRVGDGKAAIKALEKSIELRKGGDPSDWFFLSMAHWQNGEKHKARSWYDKAVRWMEENKSQDEESRRFAAEAAAVLGVTVHPKATEKKEENSTRSSKP